MKACAQNIYRVAGFALVMLAARAQGERTLFQVFAGENPQLNPADHAPAVDPKALIKHSLSPLKDREPDMTAEESAIYDNISTLLTTNPQMAVQMLEAMMNDKEQPSPAFSLILGNAYFAANQYERAEKFYRDAAKRYPDFLRAWNNLGILYYTTEKPKETVECFTKSISLGDREASTYGMMAYTLEKQGDSVSAEMYYLEAITRDPLDPDWKEGLLRIYVDGKQYGRAEPLARALIKAKPSETRYWFDYASILVAQHRKVDAIVVLDQAVAAGATEPEGLALLGDLYSEQGLAAKAVAVYQKLLATAPDRGREKILSLARALAACGNASEAEKTLALLTKPGSSDSIEVCQARADVAMARQDWAEARRNVEAVLAADPLNGHASLLLGRIYTELHDVPHATIAFEAAFRRPETLYQASIELANIEVKNRHWSKAADYLEKALSVEKTDVIEDYLMRVKALIPRENASS